MGAGVTPGGVVVRTHTAKNPENDAGDADIGSQIPSNPCSNPKNPSKKHAECPAF
jgi:hypothetical protein